MRVGRHRAGHPAACGLAVLVLVLYVSDAALGWAGPGLHGFLRDWFVFALLAGAAASVLWRAFRIGSDRSALLLLGAGIGCYAAGTLVFVVSDPGPSILDAPLASDVLWLAFYPAAVLAVVLLVAPRARRIPFVLYLEAGGVALSLTAIVAAVSLPIVQHPVHETTTVAVGLAFPCFDVVLVTLMVWALMFARWRHRGWGSMTLGFLLLAVGDTLLAIRGANGVFVRGELTSTCFPLAMLAVGFGTREPPPTRLKEPVVSLRLLALPATVFMAAVALLGVYIAHPFARVAAALAVAALVVGVVRAAAIAVQVRELYETRRYARGFEDASLGMALVSWDLRWLRVNPALCAMLRYPAEQLIGRSVLDVSHEDDRLPVEEQRTRGLDAAGRSTFQKRYVRADGAVLNVEITTSLIEDDDLGTYFYTQVEDVTDRRRAEQRQALIADLGFRALDADDVDAYLQQVVEAARETLDVVQCAVLTTGEQGRLDYLACTGFRIEPYPSDSMAGWVLGQQRAVVSNDLTADDRFTVRHPDHARSMSRGIGVRVHAHRPHVLLAVAPPERKPFDSDDAHFLEAVANILTSVLDRAATDRELRRLALVDSMTGLANRATLDHHLTSTLAAAGSAGGSVAVLLLDVDNFKIVNDTLGHPVGDQLLRQLGERLRLALRDEGLLARLGGDEFVVVCAVAEEVGVCGLADRLLAVLDHAFAVEGHELHLSASIGIVVGGHAAKAAEMLRDADIAMYRAKTRPGNAYEVFDADLRRQIVAKAERERELRDALRTDDQLVLYYQPIVDLQTGEVLGFESLVRWQHPRDGLLAPDAFLSVAEDSGLIVPLGEHLLELVCSRLRRWDLLGGRRPYVSFNLSPRQLTADVPGRIARCLRRHGVDPGQLVIEVTENVLLDPLVAVPVLHELRAMGVAVALDDFGTGYSSLSYLETYPLDAIKLDRGFVARAINPRSAAILRAAVGMGAALGLEVIAEGIEHEEQRELLRSLGCPKGQGYLFARPMPGDEADALVSQRRAGALSGAARRR